MPWKILCFLFKFYLSLQPAGKPVIQPLAIKQPCTNKEKNKSEASMLLNSLNESPACMLPPSKLITGLNVRCTPQINSWWDLLPVPQENSTSFLMLSLEMSGSFHSSPTLAKATITILRISWLPFFKGIKASCRGSPLIVTDSPGAWKKGCVQRGEVWRCLL